MKKPAHLALHPFGQIPTYEKAILGLFETGAIVFHIAQRHAGLPADDPMPGARDHWMFAALSTVEPPILELGTARLLEGDKSWSANACLSSRIASVTGWANFPSPWRCRLLDGAFSAAT